MTNLANITNDQLDTALGAELESCAAQGIETSDLLDALFEERGRRIKAAHARIMGEEAKDQAELVEGGGAVKIQQKNGRNLYFDGDSYIMSGQTGVHTLAASETSFERLAAHWSGFTGAKNSETFALSLKRAIVKASLNRRDYTDDLYNNHFRGGIEMRGTCFDLGVRRGRGEAQTPLAFCEVTAHYTPDGNIEGYDVFANWNRSHTTPGGMYCSDFFPCFINGQKVPARTARAAAEAHLVDHILDVIASARVRLAQVVGVEA